uniref:4-hydroxy-7-methoxy-3-oxo-3,4-dihydro-2H-1,4-benzoxazin-2-yl glucosidebeta-D-glucosidase n=1 Tax=Oryza punctata TaxID=4537 RepID=A0A0E0JT71_ORYPU
MAIKSGSIATVYLSLLLPQLLLLLHGAAPAVLGFTRGDFPEDFVFGSATSSYQYEGGVDEDGRSPSNWDIFTHEGKMPGRSTADVAADGYHKYKDDLKLMVETNLEAYRLSISWSRLIPNGRGAVNPKGLQYYNYIIDELVKNGIQVHIMIYQLDLPQVLEDEYGGWLSPRILEDFKAYADVCFREFGDRVSHWITIDEPNVASIGSYDSGQLAPGRCSDPFGIRKCTIGNSSVEPYIAVHNMLLAHASVTKLYREKYQVAGKGVIGISVYTFWAYPLTNSTVDLEATKRCQDFMLHWTLRPLVFGDYPQVMKNIVGSRLPSFTKAQSEDVKGSLDFIGMNHYYSLYVNDRPLGKGARDFVADMSVYYRGSKTDPPPGYGSSNDTIHDHDRIDYLKSYIGSILTALRNGANVKGYFVWSFVDVFEYLSGYGQSYGLYRVDFADESRPRQARLSARWYSGFLKNRETDVQNELSMAAEELQYLLNPTPQGLRFMVRYGPGGQPASACNLHTAASQHTTRHTL